MGCFQMGFDIGEVEKYYIRFCFVDRSIELGELEESCFYNWIHIAIFSAEGC